MIQFNAVSNKMIEEDIFLNVILNPDSIIGIRESKTYVGYYSIIVQGDSYFLIDTKTYNKIVAYLERRYTITKLGQEQSSGLKGEQNG